MVDPSKPSASAEESQESQSESKLPASTAIPDADHEPSEAELLRYMRKSSRHKFEKPTTSHKDKARILRGAKERWRAAHKPPRDLQVQKHAEGQQQKSDARLLEATKKEIERAFENVGSHYELSESASYSARDLCAYSSPLAAALRIARKDKR